MLLRAAWKSNVAEKEQAPRADAYLPRWRSESVLRFDTWSGPRAARGFRAECLAGWAMEAWMVLRSERPARDVRDLSEEGSGWHGRHERLAQVEEPL
jgi:hypothetical protein